MTKERRTKLRSLSQRIGELGENVFRTWATEQGLSPTKPGYDYGIDFFCSVFCKADKGAEAITGAVLSVQVRSTSVEDRQRIVLDRTDAETALRVDTPYVLVGIDVAAKQVRFRFMDEVLIKELQAFLQSEGESHSLTFESTDAGNGRFAELLAEVCRPAFQQRLRWTRAKIDVSAVVPGSRLAFRYGNEGGVVLVKTPLITSAFAVLPAQQEEAARLVFEEGRPPDDLSEFALHPEILSLGTLVDGPVLVTGPFERQTEVSIERPGFPRVTVLAGLRTIGDELGVALKTGLYLIFSEPRMRDGQWVHGFRHGIATKGALELTKAADELQFLKSLREGSAIVLGNGSPIPIDHWGNLKYLGPDLETLEKVFAHLGLPVDGLRLADAVQQHVLMTTGLIAAFFRGVGIERVFPGFVYEEAIHGNLQQRNWKPCGFRIPIVMNLGSAGVVLWSLGEGSVYVVDNLVCGFRPERQQRWEVKVHDEPFAGLTVPELWLYREWPPIPLDIYEWKEAASLQYRGELPFGGEVYDLSDPAEEAE